MKLFADSFFYLALFNPKDKAHFAAQKYSFNLQQEIITTPWILIEFADALAAKENRFGCSEFIRQLQRSPSLEIVHCTDLLLQSGLKLYQERSDKDWSLTDCISFSVMKQKRLTHALTGDRHFEQAGFIALLKKH